MSTFESALHAALQDVCERSYPDIAPQGVSMPYVVWQLIGGPALYFLNNSPASKREHRVQVTAWALTRLESVNLIRDIEAKLVQDMGALVQGEPLAAIDEGGVLRGMHQDFLILFDR